MNPTTPTHTCNPVPLILTVDGASLEQEGTLADVAPTMLRLLEILSSPAVSGRSLLEA